MTASVIMLGGCFSTTDSDNIASKGVWSRMTAQSDGKNTEVTVELNVENDVGTNIQLANNESLIAQLGQQQKELNESNVLANVSYSTNFATSQDGSVATVTFNRDDGSVLTSTATIPDSFTINQPLENQSAGKNDRVNVDWTTTSGETNIDIRLTATCTFKSSGLPRTITQDFNSVGDTGAYSINLSNISGLQSADLDQTKDCSSTVTLWRKMKGKADSKLAAGSLATGIQKRQSKTFLIKLDR